MPEVVELLALDRTAGGHALTAIGVVPSGK
jgi:hypothetical protein